MNKNNLAAKRPGCLHYTHTIIFDYSFKPILNYPKSIALPGCLKEYIREP